MDKLSEEKPVQIYVSLTAPARRVVESIRDETGVPVTEAMRRILEWYASFDAKFRLAVLNRDPNVRNELTQLAMASLAADPTKDLPASARTLDRRVEVAEFARKALERSKKPKAGEEIPTLDLSVAAGPWINVAELLGAADLSGKFRIRISGESMEPAYNSGTLIQFDGVQNPILVGRDYYVEKKDGTATFKRLELAGGETLTLRAVNKKKYPNAMRVNRADVARVALATEIVLGQ